MQRNTHMWTLNVCYHRKGNSELQQIILRNCPLTAWLWKKTKLTDDSFLRSKEQGKSVTSLCELMLDLHHGFLTSLSPKGKNREKIKGLSKRRISSHKVQKSPQKKVSVETEVYKATGGMFAWLALKIITYRSGRCWESTWLQNAMKQTHGREIHEGHWYRSTAFTLESLYAGNSENTLDANGFVLVLFLHLSLGFSQLQLSEAECSPLRPFGLMQLYHFPVSPTAKSLNPVASQTRSQRPWALDGHVEQFTPSQDIFPCSGKRQSYNDLFQGHYLRKEC